MSSHVWYAGYGSNLNRQRFHCYIEGGIPEFGAKREAGCSDRSLPREDRWIRIPYPLYFAWPSGMAPSQNWGAGGVAFLEPSTTTDAGAHAIARIWKISSEQYEEVRNQEGRALYDLELDLGNIDGIPVRTMTHSTLIRTKQRPSDRYLKTIAKGLHESGDFIAEEFVDYMSRKSGIENLIRAEELDLLFRSAT